jgi:hypothetical protein
VPAEPRVFADADEFGEALAEEVVLAAYAAAGDRPFLHLARPQGPAVTTLDALARDGGTFLVVAIDQRESLRRMLGEHHPAPIEDERLVRFKLAVARELAPHASGFLSTAGSASTRLCARSSCRTGAG